ncbi:MAG: F0F1 ATP synthase subunit epsilon [Myxococcota bacterium]
MGKLSVEVVTPEKRLLSVQADEAVIPGHLGLFGVRPGHTPFLSLMEPGVLTLQEGSTRQTYFLSGGFVEVGDDRVLVLADSAEPTTAIDVAAAQKRLAQAQERLKGLGAEDARFDIEQAAVKVEAARIAAVHVR